MINVEKVVFKQLENIPNTEQIKNNIDILSDVSVKLEANIGSTIMNIGELKHLHIGTLVPLHKDIANLTIELKVGNKKVATGEIVTDDNETFVKIVSIP